MSRGRSVPIIDLVSIGAIEEVQALLKKGCDVNEKSHSGTCAVIQAVGRNDDKMLAILIKAKAKVDVKDPIGRTALELAQRCGFTKVVELIVETLATQKPTKPEEKKKTWFSTLFQLVNPTKVCPENSISPSPLKKNNQVK
ncbi:MAG: ankyrin repeat domain-containing protein [Gammaproteobacteria bacterium]|nr:ankyrin repeat domain-containing protein [Gammaproteobacteria bacterium]